MRKLILPFVFVSLIVSGCTHSNTVNKDNGKSSNQVEKSSPNNQRVKHEKNVILSFKTVHNEQRIRRVSQMNNEKIIKAQSLSSGTVILYTKKNDKEHVYGAFKNHDKIYELGVVGGNSPQNNNELVIKELRLFHKSLVRIDGVFGANAPIQNYFSVENGRIMPFLRVDTGHSKEVDLDNDGTKEIVSIYGTPTTAYVYKWTNGKFKVANINEALNATSVNLNTKNQFEAWFKGSNKPVMYIYKNGVLMLMPLQN